jgi:hypothetical protein
LKPSQVLKRSQDLGDVKEEGTCSSSRKSLSESEKPVKESSRPNPSDRKVKKSLVKEVNGKEKMTKKQDDQGGEASSFFVSGIEDTCFSSDSDDDLEDYR